MLHFFFFFVARSFVEYNQAFGYLYHSLNLYFKCSLKCSLKSSLQKLSKKCLCTMLHFFFFVVARSFFVEYNQVFGYLYLTLNLYLKYSLKSSSQKLSKKCQCTMLHFLSFLSQGHLWSTIRHLDTFILL